MIEATYRFSVGVLHFFQLFVSTMFPREIETERLRLQRLCNETVDLFDYYELCSQHEPSIEDVTDYLPWNPHETVKETEEYLDELKKKWKDRTRAEYAICPKEDEPGAGEIIGSGGLIIDWETRTGKPAIWIRKQFWGNGYSGERAGAMLK